MEHRIIQYTWDGEQVKVWKSASEVVRAGMETKARLYRSLEGKGAWKRTEFMWRYYGENRKAEVASGILRRKKPNPSTFRRKADPIVEVDWKGDIIAEYRSPAEAAEKTGLSASYILNVLKRRIKHPSRKFKKRRTALEAIKIRDSRAEI